MKYTIHPDFTQKTDSLRERIANFNTQGEFLGQPARNAIKIMDLDGMPINIKSFRIPMLINGLIYNFFRKSKARRSYEFALLLLEKGIKTPQPIAYFENSDVVLRDSYYISEQLYPDLTFRELTTDLNYPDHEKILRQFVAFNFKLHQNGIEFLDNTPGNTLITKTSENHYDFFLVDLNRMNFHDSMTFNQRIVNMSRLTKVPQLIEVISDEYAKLYGKSYDDVYLALSKRVTEFQERLSRKKQLKKKLLFRK